MKFLDQFTARPFWHLVGALLTVDVISYFALHTSAETVLFVVLSLLAVTLAVWRSELVFPLALAEIFATSNGHVLNIEVAGVSIGLRMLLFGVLAGLCAWKLSRQKQNPVPQSYRLSYSLLLMSLFFGVLIGWAGEGSLTNLFLDANGYLAAFYVLAGWMLVRSVESRRLALVGAAAGVCIIALKTIGFFLLFGHASPVWLEGVYVWIRDTRLGEVTLIESNIYRIFLQGQIGLILGFFAALCHAVLAKHVHWSTHLTFGALAGALFISLSRSFWVAIIGCVVLLIPYFVYKVGLKSSATRLVTASGWTLAVLVTLGTLIALPLTQYSGGGFLGGAIRGRTTGSDIAIDSRQLLLAPMIESVKRAPIAGNGLGTTLTYTTRDQRYIDANDTDQVTTYAFEWGWLDILVKFGMIGLLIFVLFGLQLLLDLWRKLQGGGRDWLYLGLFMSTLAVAAVHVFTPYLNHPLGWAILALAAIFAVEPQHTQMVSAERKQPRPESSPALVNARST